MSWPARTLCYTSFSLSYLPRARVMARSLRAAHPDWAIWALLVDEPAEDLDESAFAPFDRVIRADALDIPDFRRWMFRHDLVEACTAVKATLLNRTLAEGAVTGMPDRMLYLDPDIAVFHGLDQPVIDRLETASLVLTPHQLAPSEGTRAQADNELTALRYGIYNLGFLAVRNDRIGRDFALWWMRLTRAACYDDLGNGIFTDQKYCDLVPALFDRVHLERDPGCNVASWNLGRRPLSFDMEGRLLADGAPLKFYHFTKIDGVGDVMTERAAGTNIEVHELVRWYRRAVAAEHVAGAASAPWAYGCFADGTAIPRGARLLWRIRDDLQASFADPFRSGPDSFQGWLVRERPELLAA